MRVTKNPLFYMILVLAVIVGLQAWGIVSAQTTFQEPASAFPASDVSAPLDTGPIPQTKYEAVTIRGVNFLNTSDNVVQFRVDDTGICLLDDAGQLACRDEWSGVGPLLGVITGHWTKEESGDDIYYNVNGGNVGIGTGSFTDKLAVQGNISLGAESFDGGYNLVFQSRDDQGLFEDSYGLQLMAPDNIIIGIDSNSNDADITKFAVIKNTSTLYADKSATLPTNTLFIVEEDGDVGIGTASPDYDLDVDGNINFTGDLYQNGILFGGGLPSATTGQILLYNGTDWVASSMLNIKEEVASFSSNVEIKTGRLVLDSKEIDITSIPTDFCRDPTKGLKYEESAAENYCKNDLGYDRYVAGSKVGDGLNHVSGYWGAPGGCGQSGSHQWVTSLTCENDTSIGATEGLININIADGTRVGLVLVNYYGDDYGRWSCDAGIDDCDGEEWVPYNCGVNDAKTCTDRTTDLNCDNSMSWRTVTCRRTYIWEELSD